MGELTLMQKFADPTLITQLTAGEKSAGALVTTLMGMGITFAVLTLLWGLVALMTKILDAQDKRKSAAKSSEEMVEALITKVPQPIATVEEPDDLELIAVITAALSASLNKPANSLVISKIKRLSGNSIAWSQAGSSDSIASRKF